MDCVYSNIKKSKMTDNKCPICNKYQTKEDIKLGCEKCNWQKDGFDVVTPYWIKYHKSKGHIETSPSQYRIRSLE